MTPERKRHLIVTSLGLRAVQEANLHYGGSFDRGLPKELMDLSYELEAEAALPGDSTAAEAADWIDT